MRGERLLRLSSEGLEVYIEGEALWYDLLPPNARLVVEMQFWGHVSFAWLWSWRWSCEVIDQSPQFPRWLAGSRAHKITTELTEL